MNIESMTTKERAVVSISKCSAYENYEEVLSSVRESLELLGNLDDLFAQNKKILLKPNLLDHSRGPESAINAHPAVVRALVQILQEDFGCKTFIGDSSGGVYGKTHLAFENTGLYDIANELGAELVNFDREEQVTRRYTDNIKLKEFSVPKIIDEVDCIINVPKLKTHDLMDYTGCIKNMFGIIPGSGKRDIHVLAPRANEMADCLVDIYQTIKPQLCVMDAVIGMEGAGPSAGTPKKIGLILASRDGVALDSVATTIVGFKPLEILTTEKAFNRKAGEADLNKIAIKGNHIEDVLVQDFKKTYRFNFARRSILPDFAVRQLWRGQTGGRPVINNSECELCGNCVESCPAKAMEIKGKKVFINYSKCIECYCCSELCPNKAVSLKFPLLVRLTGVCMDLAGRLYYLLRGKS